MERPTPIQTPHHDPMDPSMDSPHAMHAAADSGASDSPESGTGEHDEPLAADADTAAEPETGQDVETEQTATAEPPSETDRLAELEQQVAELKDQQLRKAAEMENMRKRLQRERLQIYEQSRAAAIESFLPINDDLQRTLLALHHSDADKAYLEGITMVADKFESTLERFGVERISETGVPFDVNLHEALMRQPAPEPDTPTDTVLQVLENGYRIGERVLRHAKVIVSE